MSLTHTRPHDIIWHPLKANRYQEMLTSITCVWQRNNISKYYRTTALLHTHILLLTEKVNIMFPNQNHLKNQSVLNPHSRLQILCLVCCMWVFPPQQRGALWLVSCKAFDTVPHNILVSKLGPHGLHRWAPWQMRNWLDGCTKSCSQWLSVYVETNEDWCSSGVCFNSTVRVQFNTFFWWPGQLNVSTSLPVIPSCVVRLTCWRQERNLGRFRRRLCETHQV